jgi:ADP-ribosyl-[dinitrogen reductase] hydrolase
MQQLTASTMPWVSRDVLEDRVKGLLLGQAVGDAIGLPREGLSRDRAGRMFGGPPLRHRLAFGGGMCSDDTEHACMTAVALLKAGGDHRRFAGALAWQMRGWFLSLPAGLGMATARSCIRLCLGFPPGRSGVWSAGNGPAMRATVIGAVCAGQPDLLREAVRASTRITHTDPRAEEGALAVAHAAAHSICGGPRIDADAFMHELLAQVRGEELLRNLEVVRKLLAEGASADRLAEALKLQRGVSGYINHTVPAVVFCWLSAAGDFRRAVESVVMLGGDADTTGAIVGGIAGAGVGESGIPADWLGGLCEWPRTPGYLRRLGRALAGLVDGQGNASPPRWFWPGVVPRNVAFLGLILAHGLRRAFPPY